MVVATVAISGALIPTVFYVAFVWWLDRYEKEPLWLLALSFLWGAVPAAIFSVLLELAADIPITAFGGDTIVANLASASLSAPLIEESIKGLALIGLVVGFRREFDDILDGIVFGAMIGLGFAFTENLFAYFIPILTEEGIGAGLMNIFMRAIVFGLNHAFWTGIMGAAIGYARLARSRSRRLLVPILGWAVAVLAHGIHNTGAILVEQTSCLSLGLSLVVDWGGVLLLLVIAVLVLRKESHWIERGLQEEVRRGRLTPEEYDLLRSAGRRMWMRWHAWGQGGRAAYRTVGRYYQTATELAFAKEHLRSLGDEGGNLAEVERLRETLAVSRTLALPWLGPSGS